ncbi:DUF2798 domain-containing protein [Roseococcus sp. DSY-14]|uniref:DUF2798 domain-containing protein n=1 Tax=Roseococcus sp. DSY-14 TaxID=3369650 RepID=UPI00387B48D1
MFAPRHAPLLTGFFLTFIMTFVISGVSTLLALGPTHAMLARWPLAWLTSWAIAFPTVLVVLPILRRIVTRLTAEAGR